MSMFMCIASGCGLRHEQKRHRPCLDDCMDGAYTAGHGAVSEMGENMRIHSNVPFS